jgi:hypothetical protein
MDYFRGGGGGGICNRGGHIVTSYARDLETMSNNETKAYELYEGIVLAQSMGI